MTIEPRLCRRCELPLSDDRLEHYECPATLFTTAQREYLLAVLHLLPTSLLVRPALDQWVHALDEALRAMHAQCGITLQHARDWEALCALARDILDQRSPEAVHQWRVAATTFGRLLARSLAAFTPRGCAKQLNEERPNNARYGSRAPHYMPALRLALRLFQKKDQKSGLATRDVRSAVGRCETATLAPFSSKASRAPASSCPQAVHAVSRVRS